MTRAITGNEARRKARVREGEGTLSEAVPGNVGKAKRGLRLVGKQSQMGLAAVNEAVPPRGRRANEGAGCRRSVLNGMET